LCDAGTISTDGVVVCNLTGHGLKQPEAIRFREKEITPIAPTLEELRERIERGSG
jgi:threonine synthase